MNVINLQIELLDRDIDASDIELLNQDIPCEITKTGCIIQN